MRLTHAKILLFLLIGTLFWQCNSVKRVPDGEKLLVKNTLMVNERATKDNRAQELIAQKPNSRFAGLPLALYLYNFAKPHPDSAFYEKFIADTTRFRRLSSVLSEKQVYRLGQSFMYSGIHNFFKNSGEAPVIINEQRTNRSIARLQRYYFDQGYFNNKITAKSDSTGVKRGEVIYSVSTGKAYVLDSVKTAISSPDVYDLYEENKEQSLLKPGERLQMANVEDERERLTTYFRNNGIFRIQKSHIRFEIDTIQTNHKANLTLVIDDFAERRGEEITTRPFRIHKISQVNVFVENPFSKNKEKIEDSISYKGYQIYSRDKITFRPRALTDPLFIAPGDTYSDLRTNLTSRFLSNLKIFKYPSPQFIVDPNDPEEKSLIANIYLEQLEKFKFGANAEFLHSNIQEFGIAGNLFLMVRNVFNGAERFEISARGNIGSSRDMANPRNVFFNILEYGGDMKLYFPRVLMPFSVEKIIPKTMIPTTTLSTGITKQQNIGLDRETFNATISYDWTPKRFNNARLDLFNAQYINNINTSNYFVVYRSSYQALNNLAQPFSGFPEFQEFFDANNNLIIDSGTSGFTNAVLTNNSPITPADPRFRQISSIEERRRRLTENNLILSSSFSYSMTNKKSAFDNAFYMLKTRIESAGNILSLIGNVGNLRTNANGNQTLLDVEYSQYLKGDIEFVKRWELNNNQVLASRAFVGLAAPYGNSNSIPFLRSYFGGGANDNRAWQPYSLGPGRSGGINDFNEANFKLAFNLEYRFNLFGDFKGALFTDVGNIWNVFDNIDDPDFTFNGFQSLKDLAIGSGFGIRYDFSFFVVRLDMGFKTYNPANPIDRRWFREYNFANSVLNIGVNYPF